MMMNFFIKTAKAGVVADATPISTVLINALEFLLSVLGIIGIISLVVSGLLYLLSSGNQEYMSKAKKAVAYSIIGLSIALGSYAILRVIGIIISGN